MSSLDRFHKLKIFNKHVPRPNEVLAGPSEEASDAYAAMRNAFDRYIAVLGAAALKEDDAGGMRHRGRRSRISPEQRAAFRAEYAEGGITQKVLAKRAGVCLLTMNKILNEAASS